MIEKQFGTLYGPALKRGDKAVIMANLRAEIDRRGGVPYGWLRIYKALLFGFYNPRTGACFPSHNALAEKAGSSVRCVRRALKTAREWGPDRLGAWPCAGGLACVEDQQPLRLCRFPDDQTRGCATSPH
jgi:hypothetical protein